MTTSPANAAPAPRVTNQPMRHRRRRVFRAVVMALLGWLLAAYLLLPMGWRIATRHHPAVEGMPCIAVTANRIPGDPLNIALVGSEEDVQKAMFAAGWYPADPITLRSSLKIAAGSVFRREYDTAPVSNLYVWGRKQDLAFQQPVGGDPRRRHHVRFWQSDKLDDNGRPLWVGSVTFDERVGFSHTTLQVTHHIDANVDAERDKLLADLTRAKAVEQVEWRNEFHGQCEGRNGGGDPWHTDGRAAVVYLVRSLQPQQ